MESYKRIYIVYKYWKGAMIQPKFEYSYVLTGTNLYKIRKYVKEMNERSKKYVYGYMCKDLWE